MRHPEESPEARPERSLPLKAAGLSFAYAGATVDALRSVSLDIDGGDFVLVAGPSGCGKTTLAHALTGFIPHFFGGRMDGHVLVGDLDTRQAGLPELAQQIGLVQQDPEGQLCTLRVSDEVAFGPENLALERTEVSSRVERSLHLAGASHLAHRTTATLSGGEKQRVAIASILAMGPSILLLDEPMASLDPTGATRLLAALAELRLLGGHTVVVAEHRVRRLLSLASRLIRMEQGMVIEEVSLEGAPTPPLPDELASLPHAQPINRSGPPLLSAEGMSFAWPPTGGRSPEPVLEGITLQLWPGEVACLMGDNGSGKTTLLKLLLGLLPARGMRLRVEGRDLSSEGPAQRSRQIGMVFQNPNHQISGRTVLDDALMPARNLGLGDQDTKDRVLRVLEMMGLGERLSDNPLSLSHGQKKRLALAGVLGYGPRVLLLDEPFAGQDNDFAALVITAVRRYCCDQGGAALLVNHDPDLTARCAHRVVFLGCGEVLIDLATLEAFEAFRRAGRPDYCPV